MFKYCHFVAFVMLMTFYLGLQFGLPFYEEPYFTDQRTYDLSGDHSINCLPNEMQLCRVRYIFDQGGRVLMMDSTRGFSGTYSIEGHFLHLRFNEGDDRRVLVIDERGGALKDLGTGEQWSLRDSGLHDLES